MTRCFVLVKCFYLQHFSVSVNFPCSLEEMKQTIRRHLHLQRYEEAFQVALSANSLSLVLATCEMVNPAAIFNQAADGSASVLPQPVLLALVQQLSE